MNLFATSVNLWDISQPIRDIVVNNLRKNETVSVRFSYTITRNPPNQDDSEDIAAVVTGENSVDIGVDDQVIRKALIEILNGTLDSQRNTSVSWSFFSWRMSIPLLYLAILPFLLYRRDLSMSSPKPNRKRSNLSRKVNHRSASRRQSLLR